MAQNIYIYQEQVRTIGGWEVLPGWVAEYRDADGRWHRLGVFGSRAAAVAALRHA